MMRQSLVVAIVCLMPCLGCSHFLSNRAIIRDTVAVLPSGDEIVARVELEQDMLGNVVRREVPEVT